MVVDVLDSPIGCIKTGHAVGLFKDRWHKMVQASGTSEKEEVFCSLRIGVTNLILTRGIRLAIQLFQYHSYCSVDDIEQTCDNDDMD